MSTADVVLDALYEAGVDDELVEQSGTDGFVVGVAELYYDDLDDSWYVVIGEDTVAANLWLDQAVRVVAKWTVA